MGGRDGDLKSSRRNLVIFRGFPAMARVVSVSLLGATDQKAHSAVRRQCCVLSMHFESFKTFSSRKLYLNQCLADG